MDANEIYGQIYQMVHDLSQSVCGENMWNLIPYNWEVSLTFPMRKLSFEQIDASQFLEKFFMKSYVTQLVPFCKEHSFLQAASFFNLWRHCLQEFPHNVVFCILI